MLGPGPMMLTDEQKDRLRGLVWSAARKFILASVGAVGVRVGEHLAEWVLGGDRDEDDDGDEK